MNLMPDYVGRALSGFYIWANDIIFKIPDIYDLNFNILKGIAVVFMMLFLALIIGHIALNFKGGAFLLVKKTMLGVVFLFFAGFFFTKVAFEDTNRVYVDMDLISSKIYANDTLKNKIIQNYGFLESKITDNTISIDDKETFQFFLKPVIVRFKDVRGDMTEATCGDGISQQTILDGSLTVSVCTKGNKKTIILNSSTIKSLLFTDIVAKVGELKEYYTAGTSPSKKEEEIIAYFKVNYSGKLTDEEKKSLVNIHAGKDATVKDSLTKFVEDLSKEEGTADLKTKETSYLKALDNRSIDISQIIGKEYPLDKSGVMNFGDTEFVFYTVVYKEAIDFDKSQIIPSHISFGANNANIEGLVVFSDQIYKLSLSQKNSYAKFQYPEMTKNLGVTYVAETPFIVPLLMRLFYVMNILLFLAGNVFLLLLAFNLFPLKNEVGNF